MGRHAIAMGPAGRSVARRLVRIRTERGFTQAQLAGLTECTGRPMNRQMITEIETLRRRVDVDDLVVLGRALGLDPATLLGGEDCCADDRGTGATGDEEERR